MGGVRPMKVIEGFPLGQFLRQVGIILVIEELVELLPVG
jgi:hypothetical protein